MRPSDNDGFDSEADLRVREIDPTQAPGPGAMPIWLTESLRYRAEARAGLLVAVGGGPDASPAIRGGGVTASMSCS